MFEHKIITNDLQPYIFIETKYFKDIFPAALAQIKVSTKVQKNLARKLMKQTSLGQFESGHYLR